MRVHLIFIGNKFIYNTPLKEYILREAKKSCGFINTVTYFKESDNSLFLYLQDIVNTNSTLLIVANKQNFSTVGKLISTITADNQVLKADMLVPSRVENFAQRSYLLEYQDSVINVISMDEMQKIPTILISSQNSSTTIHIFDETKESTFALLTPIAQTYDVYIDTTEIIEGWIRVDIDTKKYGNISKFVVSAKKLFFKKMIDKADVVEYIIEKLHQNNKKITFAESCTGGLLSYYFTSKNGASTVLDGSLVTYCNKLKENWLAVDDGVIQRVGAVSSEVVEEMSEGAINVSGADFAISISGIAGESGGTKEKPVGTVYVGIRSKTQHKEELLRLSGDRNYIQHQSVLFSLKMLLFIDKEIFF